MFDLLITNAKIIDGTGSDAFPGSIAVSKGKIVKIFPPTEAAEAARVLDAEGQFVTPGFIDIHQHGDAAVFRPDYGEIQVRQGVTTTINGNCGLSIVPCPAIWKKDIFSYLRPIVGSLPEGRQFETFSDYIAALKSERLPINFGMNIGNGTLRMASKGFESGSVDRAERKEIQEYLMDALQNGAFGVSMGIAYMPENQYDVDGFVQVLEPIRNSGIPLVTHIRGEGDLLLKALEEVIEVAKRLNVPLHVSHLKCVGRHNWTRLLGQALELLDRSRANGMTITCDVYPWEAGSTQLIQLLPPSYLEGGVEKTTERLRDPVLREKCKKILQTKQTSFENLLPAIGWESIMITTVHNPENLKYIGMRISEIAQLQNKDPFDCAFDLLVDEKCNVSMVNFIACEKDIETILKYPFSSVISDSIYAEGGIPHPRQYGNFTKLLCEYVRDKDVLALPQAIRKITGAPAEVLSIDGKGRISPGYDADLAIFDLARLKSNATYTDPRQFGTGFRYVLVNGEIANDNDRFLHTGSGKVLQRGRS